MRVIEQRQSAGVPNNREPSSIGMVSCDSSLVGKILVVEFACSSSSLRLSTSVHIFLDLFQDLIDSILSVIGDVPIDSEAYVVTLSISSRLSLLEVVIGIG